MLEVLRQDYIKTARAKGLSEQRSFKTCSQEWFDSRGDGRGLQFGILMGVPS